MIYHPNWSISCEWCIKHRHTKGVLERMPDGRPLYRLPTMPTPCESCPKVPQWAKSVGYDYLHLRKLANELTDQHRTALDHYRRCKGINWNTPAASDPVVQWFAGIVREIEDQFTRDKSEVPGQVLTVFLEMAARRGM